VRWLVHDVSDDDVVLAARRALAAGLGGPAVRHLAALPRAEAPYEVPHLLPEVMEEQGLPCPRGRTAVSEARCGCPPRTCCPVTRLPEGALLALAAWDAGAGGPLSRADRPDAPQKKTTARSCISLPCLNL